MVSKTSFLSPSYLTTSGVKFKWEKTAGKTRAGETRWSLRSVGNTLFGSLRRDDDERVRHEYLRLLNDQKQWFLHALGVLQVSRTARFPRPTRAMVFFSDAFVWPPLWNEVKWTNFKSCGGRQHTTLKGHLLNRNFWAVHATFMLSLYNKNTFSVLVAH